MLATRTIPIYVFHPSPTDAATTSESGQDDDGFYLPLALGLNVENARTISSVVAARFEQPNAAFFSEEQLLAAVARRGPGVCLFSSYLWNAEENLSASKAVKAFDPRCVTVHGGPSTPRHVTAAAAFLRLHPHVDIAVRGEGELTTADLLERLADVFEASATERSRALHEVSALTFRDDLGAIVRTPDRARLDDLGSLTSPYLSGYFDRMLAERTRQGSTTRLAMATLETTRGCPYQCVFCDWGSLTLQKVRAFPLERVRAELEWIGKREIQSIFLGDSNFGILARDIEVAEAIAQARQRFGFPRGVVANYAKNGSRRIAQACKLWRAAGVTFEPILSLQSIDSVTLATIRRSNIATEKYIELGNVYRELGLDPIVQLMMGLPGSTVASWKRDLQFAFDRREHVQLFPTQMLPNSPMAEPEYVAGHGIRTDAAHTIVECATFTEEEWRVMGRISCAFLLYSNWGLLRYVLMYLQWDHGVRALDFMHDHVEAVYADPAAHPLAAALLLPLFDTPPAHLAGTKACALVTRYEQGWGPFLDEVAAFAVRRYAIARDGAFEVALRAQEAVMPHRGTSVPATINLAHDFVSYISRGRSAILRGEPLEVPLSSFPPGSLSVFDPHHRRGASIIDHLNNVSAGQPSWELASPLNERTT